MTVMNDNDLKKAKQAYVQQLNQALRAKGLRTVEEFSEDAIALFKRHGSPAGLALHLECWVDENYDPEGLKLNVLTILEFQHNTLAKKQFRCDGSPAELRRLIDGLRDHSIEGYLERLQDVLMADELVTWCRSYASVTAGVQTT